MYLFFVLDIFIIFNSFYKIEAKNDYCIADAHDNLCKSEISGEYKRPRFLLYDVNPGEGFNLRRDVYMRIASLVKKLNEHSKDRWILILPPWGPLYHWKSNNVGYQGQIMWSKFFNLEFLNKYVPVMELEDFLNEQGSIINTLYYLQNYEEGWENGEWRERSDIKKCMNAPPYEKTKKGTYVGWFWDFEDIVAEELFCLSIQGYSSTLKDFLLTTNSKIIMIDRAEVILHDSFGDPEYWMVRRSMVFSPNLIQLGDRYRLKYLNSSDETDHTNDKYNSITSPVLRTAIGGPYIAVHLRRQDFVKARPKDVPSIHFAAEQIKSHMKRLNLNNVYVATDATESEFEELQNIIPAAKHFVPTNEMHKSILDGGVAIIDQWICAHSRYFFGTYESTFSFRIQEEREIIGFKIETTFNRLCGDNHTTCTQPSKWKISWI